jgi:hypothetical protein
VVGFLVEPQNQGGEGFSSLGLKITATVSLLGPQNQAGFGLSVAPQNRQRKVGAGHTLRFSSLLDVETSLARVSQSDLKTGGGATTGGARGPSQRLCRRQAKDGRVDAMGCVGPCFPCFAVFFLLCLMCVVVI